MADSVLDLFGKQGRSGFSKGSHWQKLLILNGEIKRLGQKARKSIFMSMPLLLLTILTDKPSLYHLLLFGEDTVWS